MDKTISKRIKKFKEEAEEKLVEVNCIEKLIELYPDLIWSDRYEKYCSKTIISEGNKFLINWKRVSNITSVWVFNYTVWGNVFAEHPIIFIGKSPGPFWKHWKKEIIKAGTTQEAAERIMEYFGKEGDGDGII
jgi:hypothetical protein